MPILKNISFLNWLGIAIFIFSLSSCTGTFLLPKGERLYNGAEIKIKKTDKKWETSKLESALSQSVVLPRRNSHFLWMRIKVGLYNTFNNPKKEKGFGNWIARKWGTPPVLYSEEIIKTHQKSLSATAANFGYFKIKVDSKKKGVFKKKKIQHTVHLDEPPKLISALSFPPDTGAVERFLLELKKSSLLLNGQPYQLDLLKAERQRLADSLRNDGWYYLSPDDLLFEADTFQTAGEVRLSLRFKDDVTERDRRRYHISEILIFPDHDLKYSGQGQRMEAVDECVGFVYSEMDIKKEIILKNIPFRCGELFSNEKYREALFRLQNLQFFKFVNIRFVPSMLADTLLEAHVFLTPIIPQKVEGKLSGLYSPGLYAGVSGGVTWQHRNVFGAAENLRLSWEGSFLDFGIGREKTDFSQLFGSRANAQLTLPQNIFGFRSRKDNALMATRMSFQHEGLFFDLKIDRGTTFSLGLQRLEGEGGFIWKKNREGSVTHELNPFNISLQYSSFQRRAVKDAILASIPDDESGELLTFATQIELRPNYTFKFDDRFNKNGNWATLFRQRFTLRSSGYVLPKEVADAADLGYPLNFFTETDWRQYLTLNRKTTFAYRFAFFAGLRLTANSTFSVLDLYTTGGPSSVRAYAPRTIGPGSVTIDDEGIGIIDHTGNLQILSSVELRHKLGEFWEMATFFDVGNIWLTKADENLPGGDFSSGRFYKELASATGMGLRFSLGFFVLRLDMAVPVSKPYLSERSRLIGQPGFSEGKFLGGLRGNFAFGYPF